MKIDPILAIAVIELRAACKAEPEITVRLRKAMTAAQDLWCTSDDDLRLRAAIGAAVLESNEEEARRILDSFEALRACADILSGRVRVAELTDEFFDRVSRPTNLPLTLLWKTAVAEHGRAVTPDAAITQHKA